MSKGRKIITCIKCGESQSTHSSNRNMCHKCKPKCAERHKFNIKKAKKEEHDKAQL